MDWFRLDSALPQHYKLRRLGKSLGNPDTALAVVVRLFCFVAASKPDGVLNGLTPADLAGVCWWDGDPDQLRTALVDSQILDATDAGLVLHGWLERNGADARSRFTNARRQAKYRQRHASDGESNAEPLRERYEALPHTDIQTNKQTDRTTRAPARETPMQPIDRAWAEMTPKQAAAALRQTEREIALMDQSDTSTLKDDERAAHFAVRTRLEKAANDIRKQTGNKHT